MECWHENIYQAMIDAANKRPLLSTYQGKLLKSMIDSVEYETCLDIGCGTGQVSQLIKGIYHGADLFNIIANVAEKSGFKQIYLGINVEKYDMIFVNSYDLVIMSAFVDVMEKPLEKLESILKYCSKYVIIHRQEISQEKPTQSIKNPSYGGWTWHSIINRKDFDKAIKGFEILKLTTCKYENWEDGGTSVLLKRK
jgi:SAM-dependent methyltransferase